ncbi:hypothetical protein [Nitrosospira multiformis]|uniref:hypothetical protein n=1 Tax=Nitrosospira multiformis TaxID=1231 RepID=UPI0008948B48|nr:hypothetical protein [Nitrosospira multiformis]SEA37786.1 hypothetical protein SAMN05216411_10819 [Nitrosospira multiformis]
MSEARRNNLSDNLSDNLPGNLYGTGNLLVIAHPGHELRLYGWVAQTKPLVCILTDGSGSDDQPRLAATLNILQGLGAEIGPVCGELTDRQIYRKILRSEYDIFDDLCERLIALIAARDIRTVVSDGIEGYNPTHDLCEVLVRTAVAITNNVTHVPRAADGKECPVRHYTIPLMGDPQPAAQPTACRAEGANPGIQQESEQCIIELNERERAHKLETLREYGSRAGGILQQEVEDAFRSYGEEAFGREYLYASAALGKEPERNFLQQKPFYEIRGEQRVADGRYRDVIRFHEHVLPIMNRLNTKISAVRLKWEKTEKAP